MKIAKIITMALAASFFVTGCNSSELGPPRDVEWFMDHREEMMPMMRKCDSNIKYAAENNCVNVFEASRQLGKRKQDPVPTPPPDWKLKY